MIVRLFNMTPSSGVINFLRHCYLVGHLVCCRCASDYVVRFCYFGLGVGVLERRVARPAFGLLLALFCYLGVFDYSCSFIDFVVCSPGRVNTAFFIWYDAIHRNAGVFACRFKSMVVVFGFWPFDFVEGFGWFVGWFFWVFRCDAFLAMLKL